MCIFSIQGLIVMNHINNSKEYWMCWCYDGTSIFHFFLFSSSVNSKFTGNKDFSFALQHWSEAELNQLLKHRVFWAKEIIKIPINAAAALHYCHSNSGMKVYIKSLVRKCQSKSNQIPGKAFRSSKETNERGL